MFTKEPTPTFQWHKFRTILTFSWKTSIDFYSPGRRIVPKQWYCPTPVGVDFDFGDFFPTLFHDCITLDKLNEKTDRHCCMGMGRREVGHTTTINLK